MIILEESVEIVEIGKEKNVKIVSVKGALDAMSAPEFERRLFAFIDDGDINFIVDFGELDFISSAGLRSILRLGQTLKAKKGQIRFCGLQEQAAKVFKISGFSSLIPVHQSVAEALEHM